MKTIQQLRDEAGEYWPENEPLDFRDAPVLDVYSYTDLYKVADANNNWIERVRVNFPELLGIVPRDEKPKLIDRVNKLKR